MSEQEWTPTDRPEPWEQNEYTTGSTKPPKNRGGLVIVLVAVVIFLGGILSALGLLNISPFRNSGSESAHPGEASVEFSPDDSLPPASTSPTTPATEPTDSDVTQPEMPLSTTPPAVENIPQAGGLSLQEIYRKAIDSVVSISCDTGTGTGVVLRADGYIITNCHVVEGAATIEVLFSDDSVLPAQLMGLDRVSDLALLRVAAEDLSPAEFGDSGALQVGDSVVAIGDPLGMTLRGTMTDGIISAINRDILTDGRVMTLIQTNAALNSGNSGGPLLNCYGQVIGINTMKIGDYVNAAGVEGLGFAIPTATVKEIVDQLLAQGYVSGRPALGFTGQTLTSFDQLYYRLPAGLYISDVDRDSDAYAKGIAAGDILLQFDGSRVTDAQSLETLLYSYDAGDTVSIVIYRSGRQYALDLVLSESK